MLVECVKPFRDLAEKVDRKVGEVWDVTLDRLEEIEAVTEYGQLVRTTEARPKHKGGRPTKAELVAEAEALGIEVPKGATNPQIAKLIEEAR